MIGSLFCYQARNAGRAITMSDQAVATAEPLEQTVAQRRQHAEQKTKRQPPYHVILWNDDHHSYEYVIKMLMELFGHPPEKGFLMAKEVDTQGRVIVLTTAREHAEVKRDQIHAYGKGDLIAGCKGSMRASIEPAAGE
jgi:ATP-dependent Clp protease adaptor protein ClpS